jgi:hypothetical protein
MAGITLEMAEARLALYLDAEAKILKGQRVDMDGKSLTRADLAAVQQGIALWNSRAHNLAGNNRIQVREVIPR